MAKPDPQAELGGSLLDIDIIVRDELWKKAVPGVTQICSQSACRAFSAGALAPTRSEAALVLADDDFVAALNKEYRNKPGPTNVLSFAALDDVDADVSVEGGAPLMLGDIIVARETTEREAADAGISTEDHLRHLVVHGMLHLLGFDHLEDEDAEEMEAVETQVLADMGVADPYAIRADETETTST